MTVDMDESDPKHDNEAEVEDETEDEEDPFSQYATTHPALGETFELSSDIYHPLFDWFFKSEEFERWARCKTSRQLYCIGGPGSGKTTLIALMARRIFELYLPSSLINTDSETHVATLYIQSDVIGGGQAFLEDFLHSIYTQLTHASLPVKQSTSRSYDTYTRARRAGERASTRINLISKTIHARLSDIKERGRAFLLVDSIDHCTPSLQQLVERELSAMQECGLSIMIASRLPVYEKPVNIYCDIHKLDDYEAPITLYWRCMKCKKSSICVQCHEKEELCRTCGDNTVWKEPTYLNLPIERIPATRMQDFVAWDLEREHGDLGLESDNQRKPPLSALGISFHKTESAIVARDWVEKISNEAHGNIALAKLGLDRVHSSTFVDGIEDKPDRLARNVQAIFDDGIKAIQQQPAAQRDLALKAIVSAAKEGCPSLSRLANLLRERYHASSPKRIPPRSVEDILQVAKGYLRLEPPWYEGEEFSIATYNILFESYAAQSYNDDLIWANAQLRTSNISRSFTRVLPKDGGAKREKSKDDVFGELRRFHAQSPSPVLTEESPMRGRGHLLLRSNTGITPDVHKGRAKPIGLGLGL